MLGIIKARYWLAAHYDVAGVALLAALSVDAIGARGGACGRLRNNHDFTCPLGGLWPGGQGVQAPCSAALPGSAGAVYLLQRFPRIERHIEPDLEQIVLADDGIVGELLL
jgi:hypothetical protein